MNMMDNERISIGKNGKIVRYKCNRHGQLKARDYSGRLLDHEYNCMPCTIEPGTTLADIFVFMANELATNKDFFIRLIPYSNHVPDMLHAWTTYQPKPEDVSDDMTHLELYWNSIDIGEKDEPLDMAHLNNMDFHGINVNPNEVSYAITYSEPGSLARYEVKINPSLILYKYEDPNNYSTYTEVAKIDICPTLFNIIASIVYELTWCGSQEDRRKFIDSLCVAKQRRSLTMFLPRTSL